MCSPFPSFEHPIPFCPFIHQPRSRSRSPSLTCNLPLSSQLASSLLHVLASGQDQGEDQEEEVTNNQPRTLVVIRYMSWALCVFMHPRIDVLWRSGARFISALVVLVLSVILWSLRAFADVVLCALLCWTFFLGSEPGNELGIRKADQREG
jgi:hypothetical protein